MFEDFLRSRFNEYPPGNALEQGNMLIEAMQHYVLASLSKHGSSRRQLSMAGRASALSMACNVFPRISIFF